MTYDPIFHFLTIYKVEEKREALDLGNGAATGKQGERLRWLISAHSPCVFRFNFYDLCT